MVSGPLTHPQHFSLKHYYVSYVSDRLNVSFSNWDAALDSKDRDNG